MNNHSLPDHLTLGIEFGSTRIKAVLIGPDHHPLFSGSHSWENQLVNGYWSYSMDAVWAGMQDAYGQIAAQVKTVYGEVLTHIDAMGISAMMHGYLPFDCEAHQLTPFRTWRNTTTAQAAAALTDLFQFNIPQRWSIAHLYQAILDGEAHVKNLSYLTTLAGYVHWKLTDRKVLGSGDASGMFPLDAKGCAFDPEMVARFDALLMKKGFSFQLKDVLPAILKAGEEAGVLTEKGARLLDPSGALQPGARLCPPEGDAGTGMTATNSITPCTGNVSAGTSVFAMLVLEHSLSKVHPEIDIVTTPDGKPVAMVHCNTCTSDIDAWVNLLGEMAEAAGAKLSKNRLYELFYTKALSGDPDCGGLVNYNYYSGEPVTNIPDGRPLFMRRPDADLSLANFARAQLYSAISTLKLGIDLLFQEENVQVKSLLGHGGLFKTTTVGQQLLAGALNVPVSVMETAGEGGPWGMALLASYMVRREAGETLEHYLADKVFRETESRTVQPNPADTEGFARYIKTYVRGLATERSAVEAFR